MSPHNFLKVLSKPLIAETANPFFRLNSRPIEMLIYFSQSLHYLRVLILSHPILDGKLPSDLRPIRIPQGVS